METTCEEFLQVTDHNRVSASSEINIQPVLRWPTQNVIEAHKIHAKRYLLSIDCNNSAIIVYFCAKPGQLEDPKNVLRDVSSVGHHGHGDLRFDLNDTKQIPAVCEFVNQVINL